MAANTKIWLGDSTGDPDNWDWDDAPGFVDSNWVTDDSVRCAKPVDDDKVILTGDQDIQDGLDQTAVDLYKLIIHEDYTGNIGSAGNWLEFDNATPTEYLYYSAVGANYLKGRFLYSNITGTGTDGELHLYQTDNGAVFACSKGVVFLTIEAAKYIDYGLIGYQQQGTKLSDVTLEIDSAGAGNGYLARYVQTGGTVSFDSTVKTYYASVCGGELTYLGSGDMANLSVFGGTVRFIEDSLSPWNITIGESGIVDAREIESAFSFDQIVIMPGGKLKLDNGAANVTVVRLWQHGGDVQIDNGRIYEAMERDLS